MSKALPIPNFVGKLNAEVFVHIAKALPTDIPYSKLPMRVKISCDGQVFDAELIDTINYNSYVYLPSVMCLLSFGLTYKETLHYLSKEKRMSANQKVTCYIYKKLSADL